MTIINFAEFSGIIHLTISQRPEALNQNINEDQFIKEYKRK
jgi:hypothetical protein